MANIHHKPIKRFFLDGNINDDAKIARLKIEYVRLLVSEMRLSGYVPRIDIEPDFTIEYNEKTESFTFNLSIYGIHVGKRQSECIQGIDATAVVLTRLSRSSEFSQEQEFRLNQK
jgi:hypothetical protein